ncbi:MAG: hypothetical protein OXC93_03785 [Rhodospirillaceae bacterium]|nr:hypothetical protein [Rhodospirillaceae bacterium]
MPICRSLFAVPRALKHSVLILARVGEEARLSVGLRDVMGCLYSELGWDRLLGARCRSANRIIRELVLARLSQPQGKRATVDALAHQAGITLNLDRVCQSMDCLDGPVIDKMCQISCQAAETLLGGTGGRVVPRLHDTGLRHRA